MAETKNNKGTEMFKKSIKEYLDKKASEDTFFEISYTDKKKNLDDCVTYIINQVKASGQCGFADEEIYGMAAHYYDENEENIKIGSPQDCIIVSNQKVELTAEEIEQAKKDAMRSLTEEQISLLHKKSTAPKEKKQECMGQQTSLFD